METVQVDAEALLDAAQTDENFAKALDHKRRAEALVAQVRAGDVTESQGALRCVEEYGRGIELLSVGSSLGTGPVLNLMAEMRERRASFLSIVIIDSLNTGRESRAQVEARCRQMFIDSAAVIDMPKHASPALVRKARGHRMMSLGFLNNSLKVQGIEREKKIALEDCRMILSDPDADEGSKAVASRTQTYLCDLVSSTMAMNCIESIRASFLTKSDLLTVDGLNVGTRDQPAHYIARSYMDKAGPVSMNDGTPKDLPPGITSVNQIISMSPQQLNRAYGDGAGTFFGETIFWKRHNGILLGKQKWEAEGSLNSDKATLSELWDMRWVFPSVEEAKSFNRDMLSACRAEDNNGYLDELPELSLKPGERASLPKVIDRGGFVFCGNFPKKRPKTQMGMGLMMADPTSYLQQFVAVFVVNCVVVKLYVIEGFNPQHGGLKRSCMFGDSGLINITTKTIEEWINGRGNMSNHDEGGAPQSLPEMGNLSRCANCGKKPDVLKQCTRCKKAAYCGRDCQRSHYKKHKGPCRESTGN